MQPAVITFRPDNFLTIGLIGGIVYVAAVLAVQGLARFGLVKMAAPAPSAAPAVPAE